VSRADTVVIGAGHNGLTVAARLAGRGRKVVVLERRPVIGGLAAVEEFHPGYRSPGPLRDTGLIRPHIHRELRLGRYGVQMAAAAPTWLAPTNGGHGLLLREGHNSSVEGLPAEELAAYERFRSFIARYRSILTRAYDEPPLNWIDPASSGAGRLAGLALRLRSLGRDGMLELLRLPPMSAADWLDEWFGNGLLQCGLALPAVRCGYQGPRSPGSNLNLLLLQALGGESCATGAAGLIEGLRLAATEAGAEIRTEAEVRQLLVDSSGIRGVELADGSTIEVSRVAASCDPRETFLRLTPAGAISSQLAWRIGNWRTRGTLAFMRLALAAPLPRSAGPDGPFSSVRTGDDLVQLEQAFDAVKYGQFSAEPLLEVDCPSAIDPTLAPEGHAVLSVLVHFAPYELREGWSDESRAALKRTVVDRIDRLFPGSAASVVACDLLTPADLETRFGVAGGQLWHGEHALDQWLVRPAPECGGMSTPIHGLFLCGSGSHPGGGLSCGPGWLAAQALG